MGLFAGLAAVGGIAGEARGEAQAPPSANPLVGTWTYRSFLSVPDIKATFDSLELWRATLVVRETKDPGRFLGRLDGDPGEGLALEGTVSYGTVLAARFTGTGDQAASKEWLYDYLGFLVPAWPNGVDQRSAIVGTVIRTRPHPSGNPQHPVAPAGVVAQWIAVKRDQPPT